MAPGLGGGTGEQQCGLVEGAGVFPGGKEKQRAENHGAPANCFLVASLPEKLVLAC